MKSLTRIALLVAVAALAAAITGLAWDGAYDGNAAFKAGGYRGSDVLTLALGVPLLLWSSLAAERGSRRAGLLLPGAFAYLLYAYGSFALNAAYSELFLLYTLVFGASLFGFVMATRAMPVESLAVAGRLQRRVARFLIASAIVTAMIWLGDLVPALMGGTEPELHGSTTAVTYALDIGLIVPAVFLAGVLVGRGAADGYRLALPLLVLEVSLLPMIVLQTVFQLDAGVSFTTGEIVGPIVGFSLFALVAALALRALLAAPPRRRPQPLGALTLHKEVDQTWAPMSS